MSAAEKIASFRKNSGVSQSAVALAVGRTQAWVSFLERGLIPLDPNTIAVLRETISRLRQREQDIRVALATVPRPATLCRDLRAQL